MREVAKVRLFDPANPAPPFYGSAIKTDAPRGSIVDGTQFAIDTHPDSGEIDRLKDRIDTFNLETTKIYDFEELAIFLRDASEEMVAGLYAYTWGGCLEIKLLWVRDDCRRRGLGSKLMDAAEREGAARGCHVAVLDTHSFQAPDFYKRRGYEEIGVVDGYPIGHKKYFLKKVLAPRR